MRGWPILRRSGPDADVAKGSRSGPDARGQFGKYTLPRCGFGGRRPDSTLRPCMGSNRSSQNTDRSDHRGDGRHGHIRFDGPGGRYQIPQAGLGERSCGRGVHSHSAGTCQAAQIAERSAEIGHPAKKYLAGRRGAHAWRIRQRQMFLGLMHPAGKALAKLCLGL